MELQLELQAGEEGAALPEGTPTERRRPRALTLPGSAKARSERSQDSESSSDPHDGSMPRPQLSQAPAVSPTTRNKVGKQSPRTLQRWTSEIGKGVRPTAAATQSPAHLLDHGDASRAAPGHREPSTGSLAQAESPGWVEMYQLRSSLDKRIARLKVVAGEEGVVFPHGTYRAVRWGFQAEPAPT